MINDNNIESLIAKVLANEATDSEVLQVNSWRSKDAANEAHFNALQRIFHLSTSLKPGSDFNTDVAWQNVKQTLFEPKLKVVPVKHNASSFTTAIFRVAAMVLLVAGFGYTTYKLMVPDAHVQTQNFASTTNIQKIAMPDSSEVTLNKNSVLEYRYDDKLRIAKLSGEAFFDLADDKRPFILEAATLTITDIGTSFNAKAYANSDSVIVIVASGEVILKSNTGKEINLIKGNQAVYLKQRDNFIKSVVADTNALAYKTKIFVFENSRMDVIIDKLNEVYGTSIILSENLSSCKLTATFKNESIDNIIEVISETLNFTVENEGNRITLKGENCD